MKCSCAQMLRLSSRARAFTLLELMVVLGIAVILAGIIVPKVARLREESERVRCRNNLSIIGKALGEYGKDNRYELPRVVYDQANAPRSFTAFTGPDAGSAFAKDSAVAANDVTASLWLLVRGGYIKSEYSPPSAVFICPSSGDTPDPITDEQGNLVALNRRSNFRSLRHLSYSYASPFSDASGYGLKSDFIESKFVLLADRNPGRSQFQNVTGPAADSPAMSMRIANSWNHGQAGQNVLYGDSHVEFVTTPYCGVEGDNIYTAQTNAPVMTGQAPPATARGYLGTNIGPAWPTDSYLVPAEGY